MHGFVNTKIALCDQLQCIPPACLKTGRGHPAYLRRILGHLTQYFRKGIYEMARVVRTGGEIVAVDTNESILSRLPRKIFSSKEHFSSQHKNFHRTELIEAYSQCLQVESVGYFGYLAYPILGFPDIVNIFHFFPLKDLSYKMLMKTDSLLARIPGIRSQAWALLIKARKTHRN